MPKKKSLIAISVLLLISILAILSLYLFRKELLRSLGGHLVYQDSLEKCDTVVSLAGGFPDRVMEAGDIFLEGYASRIIIISDIAQAGYYEAKKRGLAVLSEEEGTSRLLDSMKVPAVSVTYFRQPTDRTKEEAVELKKFIEAEKKSMCLIIVTSKYHTLRTKKVFSKTFGDEGIKTIIRYPPFDDYDPDNWWTKPRYVRNVVNEYIKLMTMFFY